MVRIKKYTFFIGIDVSKSTLDFVLMKSKAVVSHTVIGNNPIEIKQLVSHYKTIEGFTMSNSVFGMEDTGIYCSHLKEVFLKLKAVIVIENARHIRNSLGNIRGKADKIDAERIALYLYKSRDVLRIWESRRPIINQLANLSSLRSRLISLYHGLKTPLQEGAEFLEVAWIKENNNLCSRSSKSLQADIKDIDISIKALWASDDYLSRLMKLVLSVPSIGEVTALQIIITTNEFKSITSPKKFACYAGIAPFPYKSGSSVIKRTRVSSIANIKMKTLLHICAMGACRYSPDIKEYYKRKTEVEGKNKMLVLNAVRYKLILRVFACVTNERLYSQDYTYISSFRLE